MTKDDVYYRALRSRDPRFDGKFFVGVKTTGIYCRPICPAKPKRENVEFFAHAVTAERAGYRPCLRCRPESAPDSPAWVGTSAIVQRALKMLTNQDTIEFAEDRFAAIFGVSARHLRRLFTEEIGKTPKQLCFEHRLNLSRKLIGETSLSMSEVAFAAGFSSVRRFNDAFKDRFKRSPSEIRRRSPAGDEGLTISLSYRPPFDFDGLLKSYESHRMGRLEWFGDGKMSRLVSFKGKTGTITISNDAANSRVLLGIDFPDPAAIHMIVAKVRAMFDLGSDPILIANAIEGDPAMKRLWDRAPGIRLRSGWDGFEIAISTILGQLVSIDRGRALTAELIELLGEDSGVSRDGHPIKLFPTPEKIAASALNGLKTTKIRKQTLRDFSRAVASGELSLDPAQDVEAFVTAVRTIRGIGPWTASYLAMKVLRHTDAFPETDLLLARALERFKKERIDKMSPWRAYAAALLWRESTAPISKGRAK